MPSEKFRITTNGQSLRNPNNGFFGMTLSANMTLDESSDTSAHNDRRSAHNALERQRREHLNVKFQQLAHALPALSTVRRPSKTMIVAKSLEFVSSSLKRESTFMTEIQKLRVENEKLRKQAEANSIQLKKQMEEDETNKNKKRKASVDIQNQQEISPPCTPEKKRKKMTMVKQTKSPLAVKREESNILLSSTTTATTSPWTPVLDTTLNSYPSSSPPNYFDTTYTTSPTSQNMLYMTPQHVDLYENNMSVYHNMMNPMLLSPYFVPTSDNTTEGNNHKKKKSLFFYFFIYVYNTIF
ncbi:uncharacterized protein EV154DRAFT_426974 [Mucor mucedo]|uniref:uncharacterized protein n=1 Tax=Mucor mucedo TaxID=29922 RepID=UPI00222037BE|nr:uncharacterized protein EV154DRAFT_426974 [Mucor mucedo]KAI7887711.1 hypothetical protein EV154DRAFT_426974 [Mucor mucedo]